MRIDWWTLALQTVNVLILIWLLARFFFRPIMDIIAERQQEANRLVADAAADRQEAANMRADADKAQTGIAAERGKLIAAAQAEAQSERQNLLAQASQEIAKLRADAQTAIARDQAAAQQKIIAHAGELSVDIARRLLERFPHRDVLHAFAEGLCREVQALPVEARASVSSSTASGHRFEVVTAAPLSDEETRDLCAALEQAFGAKLPLTFRSDPGIIAGIELNGPTVIIRNSWRADLDRIRKELQP